MVRFVGEPVAVVIATLAAVACRRRRAGDRRLRPAARAGRHRGVAGRRDHPARGMPGPTCRSPGRPRRSRMTRSPTATSCVEFDRCATPPRRWPRSSLAPAPRSGTRRRPLHHVCQLATPRRARVRDRVRARSGAAAPCGPSPPTLAAASGPRAATAAIPEDVVVAWAGHASGHPVAVVRDPHRGDARHGPRAGVDPHVRVGATQRRPGQRLLGRCPAGQRCVPGDGHVHHLEPAQLGHRCLRHPRAWVTGTSVVTNTNSDQSRCAAPVGPRRHATSSGRWTSVAVALSIDPVEVRRATSSRPTRSRTRRQPVRSTTAATTRRRSTVASRLPGTTSLRAEQAARRAAGGPD